MSETKKYDVEIEWAGSRYETIEAESLEDARQKAGVLAIATVPADCSLLELLVYEA